MIEASKTLAVNAPDAIELTVDDLWDGLVMKAENPLPFVRSITECTVAERFDGGLVRDVVHVGKRFVRTHGEGTGMIVTIDGVEAGSDAEAAFAEPMEADYLDAAETTLRAVRARVSEPA
ncbi:AtaL-like protein [Rhodococcus opacus]|uniref:Uncharacterized protein n=1 Tax=Rhodococcus opacus TaxID=37919 RepID=A0A076F010_RHOOP|nr:AtaL-like protein [Rhodococcus opacus]AII11018.1 hypothetical protein EP51_43810 [Rhodococcus opacus]